MENWNIQETSDGVQFKIKVQPRAKKNEVSGLHGDEIKVRLTAPPVDGEANEACLKFIAGWLEVPLRNVKLISGQKSQHKLIEVKGMSKSELLEYI